MGTVLPLMFPFCLTMPYGGIVLFGGVMGFLAKGSLPSLLAGGGSGALLCAIGFKSYKLHISGEKYSSTQNYLTMASLLVAIILSIVMGKRFASSGSFMPAGLVCLLSTAMIAFYLWCLKKADTAQKEMLKNT